MAKSRKAPVTGECSAELKRQYGELFQRWSRKYRLGSFELAERCGVSTQYLGHISRYGRIPSRPIMLLLALNLEAPDTAAFLRAGGCPGPWPFESGVGLRAPSPADNGFISLNVDLNGLVHALSSRLQTELRPKSYSELLSGRALRIGLNRDQHFLFDEGSKPSGFFCELMRLVALSLHVSVEFAPISFTSYRKALDDGSIDMYGPLYATPPRITASPLSAPFCWVRLGAVGRVKRTANLTPLPLPKRLNDLRKKDYVIAVHRDSMSHHMAVGELGIPPERLVECEHAEETVERIILTTLPRPAHLVLTDLPHAVSMKKQSGSDVDLLFSSPQEPLPQYEDTVAVRADWIAVLPALNDAFTFLRRSDALARLEREHLGEVDGVQVML